MDVKKELHKTLVQEPYHRFLELENQAEEPSLTKVAWNKIDQRL